MDNLEEESKPEEKKSVSEKILEKRERKIINWFKNSYNLILVAVIAFTIIIHIYYFIMTYNQPLWWDEADYMDIARNWITHTPQVLDPVRQYLFSLLIFLFLKIANNEFLPRLLMLFLSFGSVIGTYLLGKELYNKKVALFASFLTSVFYLNLFFTYRLLEDMQSLAFFTLSAYFFYKYLKDNSVKSLYIAAIVIGIGTMFKLTTAYILVVVLIYLLATQRFQFLKKKEIWISAVIYWIIISPYIVWGYFQFHGFVLAQAASEVAPTNIFSIGWSNFTTYLSMFPTYIFNLNSPNSLWWYLTAIALIALLIYYFYKLFLGIDILIKKKEQDKNLTRDLYIFLLLAVPLILVSIMIGHYEDRYVINIFPAFFIIIGVFVFNIFDLLKSKKMKSIAIIFFILIIIFFTYTQLTASDSLIKNKLTSYAEIREAAFWIKENTQPSDAIISQSAYQMEYYSGRNYIMFPQTEDELKKIISENNPKYYMVSAFEQTPDWSYSYPQENNLTVVQVYFADVQKQQPLVIIYEFPKNFNSKSLK